MNARETAIGVLAKISGTAQDEIKPEMGLAGDLGIDSPKALELLMELEEKLEIEIGDEDAAKMETVGDVLGYLSTAT